jgi:hypothetical protein
MYIFIYIYIYMYMCIYIYGYILKYIYIYVYSYIFVFIIYINANRYIHVIIYTPFSPYSSLRIRRWVDFSCISHGFFSHRVFCCMHIWKKLYIIIFIIIIIIIIYKMNVQFLKAKVGGSITISPQF